MTDLQNQFLVKLRLHKVPYCISQKGVVTLRQFGFIFIFAPLPFFPTAKDSTPFHHPRMLCSSQVTTASLVHAGTYVPGSCNKMQCKIHPMQHKMILLTLPWWPQDFRILFLTSLLSYTISYKAHLSVSSLPFHQMGRELSFLVKSGQDLIEAILSQIIPPVKYVPTLNGCLDGEITFYSPM